MVTIIDRLLLILSGVGLFSYALLFWWAMKVRAAQKQGKIPTKRTSYILFVACGIAILLQIVNLIFVPFYNSYKSTKTDQQHIAATATVASLYATSSAQGQAQGQATMAAKITATAQSMHDKKR